MHIIMTPTFTTVSEIEEFLNTSDKITLFSKNKADLYEELNKFLQTIKYNSLQKKEKTIVKNFIKKVTGYSKGHIKRLISSYKKGKLEWSVWQKEKSTKTYHKDDIILLHKVDKAHNWLSGIATKKILERAFFVFGKTEYENIKNISITHLYRLRASKTYKCLGGKFEKTKYKSSSIGERRKPNPYNCPGFIRIDTVHQGDFNGQKGVYWINMVDEVTQFEFVFCVPEICHKFILPILEKLEIICPFVIINFHSDNGSEFINRLVAAFLNKKQINQTKSRPRRHNDNALIESKNGSIIRKDIGYFHIPATSKNANLLNQYCENWLNPYLNFHRPCLFPTTKVDKKGKEKKIYKEKDALTPYEKLKTIPQWEMFLSPRFSPEKLQKIAHSLPDTEFSIVKNQQKHIIFLQLDF